jgi:uncharacterized phage protein gp47/JayE
MPLSQIASLATLEQQAIAFVRTRFPGRATGPQNFLGKIARVVAMALFGLQRTAEAIDKDAVPTNRTSTLALDLWAFVFGVPSNAGGYGRNQPTAATGGQAPVTGRAGITVAAGLILTAPDGVTQIRLNGPVTLPGTGSFVAVTKGTSGNLPAGTQLSFVSPPAGCDGTVTLTSPLGGALDLESNASLLQRIYFRLQTPPKGGAVVDYKTWAEEIDGVYIAYVYPRRLGSGTVDVVITAAGSGAGRVPPPAVQNAVTSAITALLPTDVEIYETLVPSQPAGKTLSIRVRAVAAAAQYAWDWDDTSASYTVAAFAAGPPATVTLNIAAPVSLTTAIDGGFTPRIQIVSSAAGAPVVPMQARVTAYDGTKTILTLENPTPAGLVAPNVGDAIYAGSYAAPLVAQAVLAYVDSVGPSRASGYGDIVVSWDDLISIWRIGQTAIDVLDTDGRTKMVKNLVPGGVTIAVGAGAPSAVDYQPTDTLIAPPELALAARVVCTQ